MRATPKTSSPGKYLISLFVLCVKVFPIVTLTLADLGTKRDVLGGGAFDLLLGRHLDGDSEGM
jgi:hypothetical protein